jgi:hypothetical protein
MRPPNSVDTNIAYLSEEGLSFTKVLRCEILARHHYLFKNDAVIQRIFNFTFWYDQHKAKTLRYDETTLNAFERENLRRLGKVLNEGFDIHYWDGLKPTSLNPDGND